MLEMRPSCECCDTDLPADQPGAMICSHECTFCVTCVDEVLHGICPNCGGSFSPRPVRSTENLARFPAATQRIFNPAGCGATPRVRTGAKT